MGRLITSEEDEFAFILFSSCAFTRAGDACAFMEDAFPNKQQKSRPITASGLHLSRTFVTVCESASSRGNQKKKKADFSLVPGLVLEICRAAGIHYFD